MSDALLPEAALSDAAAIDALKAELRKLSARAVQAKMDLHDLSEDLPVDWRRIPETAARAHAAFERLEARRADLEALEARAEVSS